MDSGYWVELKSWLVKILSKDSILEIFTTCWPALENHPQKIFLGQPDINTLHWEEDSLNMNQILTI